MKRILGASKYLKVFFKKKKEKKSEAMKDRQKFRQGAWLNCAFTPKPGARASLTCTIIVQWCTTQAHRVSKFTSEFSCCSCTTELPEWVTFSDRKWIKPRPIQFVHLFQINKVEKKRKRKALRESQQKLCRSRAGAAVSFVIHFIWQCYNWFMLLVHRIIELYNYGIRGKFREHLTEKLFKVARGALVRLFCVLQTCPVSITTQNSC